MIKLDKGRRRWIEGNLRTTHDVLSIEEALNWEALFHADTLQFFSSAIFGFVKRRFQERGQTKFSDYELKEFCWEFREKIRLAVLGAHGTVSLPLFEICGMELMRGCKGQKGPNEFIAPGGSA